ncbi:Hypothetical protein ORPV_143 [Orpheovirus IHUMI-LCC2]|uniref:Uncharacterized protein n=1 Tax=Orpheovirus IHUMI-LCC2 TaxID=2023057 RepID=A0A2I2L3F5_9VIRU|nr:Hypothetical protein ORPV_143 [Orpheovirus IHUMI-LCC2]SNW62047.1 Hypothetical protein ORPV_143 [Orpheovirus IHUMI-LCC2]
MDTFNLLALPRELQFQAISNITDCDTLDNIIQSNNKELYDIAKYSVNEINSSIYDILPSTVGAFPYVKKVSNITISSISDIYTIASHPSLSISTFNFRFDDQLIYPMMLQFLKTYINGYKVADNGKEEKISNNFKNKCFLFRPVFDFGCNAKDYILVYEGTLIVHCWENKQDDMLKIISFLIKSRCINEVYLSMRWNLIRSDNDIFEVLNNFTIYGYVNIVLYSAYDQLDDSLNQVLKNLREVNIIKNKFFNQSISLSSMIEGDLPTSLSAPLEIEDALSFFSDVGCLSTLGLHTNPNLRMMSIKSEKAIIDKIINSKLHRNIRTLILYVKHPEFLVGDIKINDRSIIFKQWKVCDFECNSLFKEITKNM